LSTAALEIHRTQVNVLVEELAQTLHSEEQPAIEVASEPAAAAADLEIMERRLEEALEELRARRRTLEEWPGELGPRGEE
jgi:hypothetical protein